MATPHFTTGTSLRARLPSGRTTSFRSSRHSALTRRPTRSYRSPSALWTYFPTFKSSAMSLLPIRGQLAPADPGPWWWRSHRAGGLPTCHRLLVHLRIPAGGPEAAEPLADHEQPAVDRPDEGGVVAGVAPAAPEVLGQGEAPADQVG